MNEKESIKEVCIVLVHAKYERIMVTVKQSQIEKRKRTIKRVQIYTTMTASAAETAASSK